MKIIKKLIRLLGLILLILVAGFGIGLSGGIPVPPSHKKEQAIEVKIEMVETKEDDEKLADYYKKT